jgi:WD40 repeat protein
LSAFREKDKDVFFGRENFVQQLVDAVLEKSLVTVIGASGSGKSSVVYAGLFPLLRKKGNWLIDSFRTGNENKSPFFNLASVLIPRLESQMSYVDQKKETSKLATELQTGSFQLSDVISDILKKNQCDRILLFADQFEEMYTRCDNEEEQHSFLNQILQAVNQSNNKFHFVMTLRVDFLGKALSYRPFADALQNADIKLGPMNRDELKKVIEKPAQAKGVEIESGLTERILNAVEGKPGNLPLLEFALEKLWKQPQGMFSIEAYEAIGGVENALAEDAEKAYNNLTEEEKQKAQQIFIQLIYPGKGIDHTRRLATRAEVGEDNWDVVTTFADQRLIVTGRQEVEKKSDSSSQSPSSEFVKREETVELIHEALIQKWERLQKWIDGDREFRTWQERLRVSMNQWIIHTKDKGYVLQGAPLTQAKAWRDDRENYLSPDEREYIDESWKCFQDKEFEERILIEANETLADANRKAKLRIKIGTIIGLLVAVVFGSSAKISFDKQQEAQEGTKLEQAGVNAWFQFKSGELSSLVSAMQSTQDLQNLIGNRRDLKDYPAVSPVLALQKILDDIHEQNYFEAGQGEVKSAVFLPGDKGFITAGEGKENKEDTLQEDTLQMWNLAGKKELSLKGLKGDLLSGINAVSVGGNAQNPVIASAGEDGTVRLWNKSGQQIKQLVAEGKPNYDSFTAIAVSPDGQKIIAGQQNGTVYLWDDKSGKKQLKTWAAHGNKVTAISFSKNGQTLATAGNDGLARIWTVTGNKQGEIKHPQIKKMLGVSLSPDGKFVATASDDNRARIWTVNGQEVRRLEGHQGWVIVVNFSPDGKSVATGSDDGNVKLWNSKTGQQIQDFRGHRGVVLTASFSPDGKRLVSAGRDGFVRLWNLADKPLQRLELTGFKDDVNAIAFSPDGKTIAGAGNEGVMRLWDAASGKQLKVWQEAIFRKQNVQDIAFSPDGKFIVVGGETNTARAWDLAGSLTKPQAELGGNEEKQELDQIYIASVAVSPKSQLIATGSYDKTMRIWKPKSPNGELVAMIPKQEEVVSRVVFTSDGKRVLTADWDGNVAMWDLAGKQISKWQKVHKNQIRGLGITQDGNRIVTADKGGDVKILDSSGKPKKEFFSYQNGINQLILSPNDKLIATAGMDGTVRLWDFHGRQVAEFRNPKGAIWGVAFSPDSQQIALAGDRGFVSVQVIESLPSLMQKGCGWLQDYLKSHPGEKDTLKVCQ